VWSFVNVGVTQTRANTWESARKISTNFHVIVVTLVTLEPSATSVSMTGEIVDKC